MKIAVLGCGNMAQALVHSMHQRFPKIQFHTFTPSSVRAKALAKKVKGKAHKKLSDLPPCDFYLIACKPQQVGELAQEFKQYLKPQSKLISILAGVNLISLQSLFAVEKIVRVMPNTPVKVGAGVMLMCFAKKLSAKEKKEVKRFFCTGGNVFELQSEVMLDQLTGVAASGPAYLFELARILESKAKSYGLPEEEARSLVAQTIFGAGKLMLEDSAPFETLRENVTSKKGVTYEALEVLKNYKWEEAMHKAVDAAYKRSVELSQ